MCIFFGVLFYRCLPFILYVCFYKVKMIISKRDYFLLLNKIHVSLTGQNYPVNAKKRGIWKQESCYVPVIFKSKSSGSNNDDGFLCSGAMPESFEYRKILQYLLNQRAYNHLGDDYVTLVET